MNLVWKLLRQHISIPQFIGFFFANLVGMLIILLGIQFYSDTQAVYNGEDSFMKSDYLIVNKKVGTVTSLLGKSNNFSEQELEEIKKQDFVEKIGFFTPSAFDVAASFNLDGMAKFSTEMFFESVPDEFIDVQAKGWGFEEGDKLIPIILPRNYLDLYNFGYAQSRSLPKLSEGIFSAIKLRIAIAHDGSIDYYDGKIVGFSGRLNTILVPQKFMDWANETYAPKITKEPTRVILQVNNPTDDKIATFLSDNNYITDQSKLDASKTTYVLKVIVSIVMGVGAVICLLSFYILMLSVYLLVEKNNAKLENLLLLGYSPWRVSLPYQTITVGLNALVFVLALILLYIVRGLYMEMFVSLFPSIDQPSMLCTMVVGLLIFLFVSCLNVLAIRNKILSIWKGNR